MTGKLTEREAAYLKAIASHEDQDNYADSDAIIGHEVRAAGLPADPRVVAALLRKDMIGVNDAGERKHRTQWITAHGFEAVRVYGLVSA